MATEQEVLPLNIKPIEDIIFNGVKLRLKQALKLEHAPQLISTTDRWNLISLLRPAGSQDQLPLPAVFLYNRTITDAKDMYGGKRLALQGVYTSLNAEGSKVRNIPMIQVIFNMDLVFVTNDDVEARRFINRWLFANNRGKLSFSLNFDGKPIDIHVQAPSPIEITTPEKEKGAEASGLSQYEAQFQVRGWISSLDDALDVDMIRETRINYKVNLDGSLEDKSNDTDIIMARKAQSEVITRIEPT